MMACVRASAPEVLANGAAAWTASWLERRAENPGAAFRWPSARGAPLNQHLILELKQMTGDRCAYCDGFPIALLVESIDHFQPKSRFPERAFAWDNLFPACGRCQQLPNGKGEEWHEDLLKPDSPDYSFSRYFRYVPGTGRLEPNPDALEVDQRRAARTIDLLGLNKGDLPTHRKRYRRAYADFDESSRAYRFIFLPVP